MENKYVNINIDSLIKELEKVKENGGSEVQLNGTLIASDCGNLILYTTIKQM